MKHTTSSLKVSQQNIWLSLLICLTSTMLHAPHKRTRPIGVSPRPCYPISKWRSLEGMKAQRLYYLFLWRIPWLWSCMWSQHPKKYRARFPQVDQDHEILLMVLLVVSEASSSRALVCSSSRVPRAGESPYMTHGLQTSHYTIPTKDTLAHGPAHDQRKSISSLFLFCIR